MDKELRPVNFRGPLPLYISDKDFLLDCYSSIGSFGFLSERVIKENFYSPTDNEKIIDQIRFFVWQYLCVFHTSEELLKNPGLIERQFHNVISLLIEVIKNNSEDYPIRIKGLTEGIAIEYVLDEV